MAMPPEKKNAKPVAANTTEAGRGQGKATQGFREILSGYRALKEEKALSKAAGKKPAMRTAEYVRRLKYDGHRMAVWTQYRRAMLDRQREIARSFRGSWNPHLKAWIYPASTCGEAVYELAKVAGDSLNRVERMFNRAVAKPAEDSEIALALGVRLFESIDGTTVVFAEFDRRISSVLFGLKAELDSRLKCFVVPAPWEDVVAALEDEAGVHAQTIERDPRILDLAELPDDFAFQWRPLDGRPKLQLGETDGPLEVRVNPNPVAREVLLAAAESRRRLEVDEAELAAASKTYGLRNYQYDGVRHLLSYDGSLLGDDMGLGKSRQAVVAALLRGGRVLVGCPAFLKLNWRDEITKVAPDQAPFVQVLWGGAMEIDPQARWVVVNYELMGRLEDADLADFEIGIFDEAHYLKEPSSLRTQHVFRVAANLKHRYLLTGTPILNRSAELYTLMRLSGHPLGAMDYPMFQRVFNDSQEGRQILAEQVNQWFLRRLKSDVLDELPGKQRQQVKLELTKAQQAEYDAVINDPDITALKKVNALRQRLEEWRRPYIVDTTAALCDGTDNKVIVFCAYKDSVAEIEERLEDLGIGYVRILGGDTPRQRKAAEDRFQNDPDVQVLVATTAAAGVGLNLTRANYVLFASLPWTPGVQDQAEDRAHRMGQEREVSVLIPLFANTIDYDLWEIVEFKRQLVDDVIEQRRRDPASAGSVPEIKEQDIERELAERLTRPASAPARPKLQIGSGQPSAAEAAKKSVELTAEVDDVALERAAPVSAPLPRPKAQRRLFAR